MNKHKCDIVFEKTYTIDALEIISRKKPNYTVILVIVIHTL